MSSFSFSSADETSSTKTSSPNLHSNRNFILKSKFVRLSKPKSKSAKTYLSTNFIFN